jgi:glucose/mannose-6-phosphate isomerase
MFNLDDIDKLKSVDTGNILDTIRRLPDQVEQVWKEIFAVERPQKCSHAANVVIAGMGGSALGGRIIDSLIVDRSRTPIEVFTQFHIPNYVGENTLVILSSYSGSTQETLSDLNDALKRRAQIFAITTGGALAEYIKKGQIDGYIIDPIHNPSKQPRMALGYSILAILAILARCDFIHMPEYEVKNITNTLQKKIAEFDINNALDKNIAKSLAKKLLGYIPVLVASEHMLGSAHAFKNQINETSKTFSVLFDIPELNHHLMEGLRNPAEAKRFLKFVFIESDSYSESVKKRYPLTKDVVEKNEVNYVSYKLTSETKPEQVFELLALSSFVSFYLACGYNSNPVEIPWVDYFKNRLQNT